ncbi:hypothetical protein [Anabaena catenula]|uniref:Uncharacterized protein n=1 Tax=Anabaena catenula FACHB-362 TaxID=2692877 RepID=A0ABR8J4Q6_9NOST|nr:hypothetical protein [Anabaena catenula]MBD2692116.1 hypothetical protein [Anabaena catenula FACHB-362]
MSDQIITSSLFIGLNDSNLLEELDNKAVEVISGGQGPLVFYACPQNRYVTNYNGNSWYRGSKGCDVYGRNEVPPEVLNAAV